jgi:hypothetical protein
MAHKDSLWLLKLFIPNNSQEKTAAQSTQSRYAAL